MRVVKEVLLETGFSLGTDKPKFSCVPYLMNSKISGMEWTRTSPILGEGQNGRQDFTRETEGHLRTTDKPPKE